MGPVLNAAIAQSSHVQASSGLNSAAPLCSWTSPGPSNLSAPSSSIVLEPWASEFQYRSPTQGHTICSLLFCKLWPVVAFCVHCTLFYKEALLVRVEVEVALIFSLPLAMLSFMSLRFMCYHACICSILKLLWLTKFYMDARELAQWVKCLQDKILNRTIVINRCSKFY